MGCFVAMSSTLTRFFFKKWWHQATSGKVTQKQIGYKIDTKPQLGKKFAILKPQNCLDYALIETTFIVNRHIKCA